MVRGVLNEEIEETQANIFPGPLPLHYFCFAYNISPGYVPPCLGGPSKFNSDKSRQNSRKHPRRSVEDSEERDGGGGEQDILQTSSDPPHPAG